MLTIRRLDPSRYERPTAQETESLWVAARGGDARAIGQLATAFAPVAWKAAGSFIRRARDEAEADDIRQEALSILLECAQAAPAAEIAFPGFVSQRVRFDLPRRIFVIRHQVATFDGSRDVQEMALSEEEYDRLHDLGALNFIERIEERERLDLIEAAADLIRNPVGRILVRNVLAPAWEAPTPVAANGKPPEGYAFAPRLCQAIGMNRTSYVWYCRAAYMREFLERAAHEPRLPEWRALRRAELSALVDRHGDAMPLVHRIVVRETACTRSPMAVEDLARALNLSEAEVEQVAAMGLAYQPLLAKQDDRIAA